MEAARRADIAYIAGRLISERNSNNIYDYGRQGHTAITGTVSENRVQVYDHSRGAHITGSERQFYDHGRNCHVTLRRNGNRFSGYDYGTMSHFSGHVSGRIVWVYDYGESGYSSHSI
jgi:hypothetical protein